MNYLYAKSEKWKNYWQTAEQMIERGEGYYELHRTVSSYAAANNIDPSEVRLVGIMYPEHLDW